MIDFPKTSTEAAALVGRGSVARAGATDLHERRRLRIAEGRLVDLRDVAGLDAIDVEPDRIVVGAKVTVAELGAHRDVRRVLPGVAAAASGLATPEIRAVGTVGGNLLQHPRCWYYRHPTAPCLRKGGHQCSARAGDHRYHACFEQGACVAVHASTLAMVMLAHDAEVEIEGGADRTLDELIGDGWTPSGPWPLEDGSILTRVSLPIPAVPERAAYFRTIARARAEWPLIEAYARLRIEDGRIVEARVVVGAVANTPLRLPDVEAALTGADAELDVLAKAAKLASRGASPLPMTEYKVPLLVDTVHEVLERALRSERRP